MNDSAWLLASTPASPKGEPPPPPPGFSLQVSGTDKNFLQKATKITKGNPAEGPGTFKASVFVAFVIFCKKIFSLKGTLTAGGPNQG
jgi:hypothetical protein